MSALLVGNAVLAATSGAPLQVGELLDHLRMVEQFNLAAVQFWEWVPQQIGARLFGQLVLDAALPKQLAGEFASVSIAANL